MEGEAAIVLIGFMGAGKSSVGRELARLTGWPLVETDASVEARSAATIAEIFADHGEEAFREVETAVLLELPFDRAIVATGGGIVLRSKNVERLRQLGRVVYLQAGAATLRQRLAAETENSRPLLPGDDLADRLARLLQEREPLYRAAAEFTIDTSDLDVDAVAQKILRHVG